MNTGDKEEYLWPQFDTAFAARLFAGALSGETITAEGSSGEYQEDCPDIEGYRCGELIGKGGMGVVYRAEQLGTGRQVALKFLVDQGLGGGSFTFPVDGSTGSSRMRRFQREIEVASRLQHCGIASIYTSGATVQGVPYYAMELVGGRRLDEHVSESGPGIRSVCQLLLSISDAVGYAHRQGVIHRDLKAPNVVVAADGVPKVLDFGLAKALEQEEGQEAGLVSMADEILGTPATMSPEQARGENNAVDTRSDVYSLGVMLCHLLTGNFPHDSSGSKWEILRRVGSEPAQIPRHNREGEKLPSDLRAILAKCLAFDPADRYSSADGLREDLARFLEGAPVRAKQLTFTYWFTKSIRRHKVYWSAGGLAMLLAGALGSIWISQIKQYALSQNELRIEAEKAGEKAAEARSLAEAEGLRARQSAAETGHRLASRYLADGDRSRAYAHLGAALRLDPGNRRARALAAMTLLQDDSLREVIAPRPYRGREEYGRSVAFSRTRPWLLVGDEFSASILHSPDGSTIQTVKFQGRTEGCDFLDIDSVPVAVLSSNLGRRRSVVKMWQYKMGNMQSFEIEGSLKLLETDSDTGRIATLHQSVDHRKVLNVWEWRDGKATRVTRDATFTAQVFACAFDFANDRIVHSVSGRNSTLYQIAFVDDPRSKPFQHIRLSKPGDEVIVSNLAVSPRGLIAAAGQGGRVSVWKADEPDAGLHLGHNLGDGGDPMRSVTFSPGQTHVLAGSRDGYVDVWKASDGELVRNIDTGWSVYEIKFASEREDLIAVRTGEPGVQLWNWRTGERLPSPELESETGELAGVSLSPEGDRLVTLTKPPKPGESGHLRLWLTGRKSGFQPVRRYECGDQRVRRARPVDGGKAIMTWTSKEKQIRFHDTVTGEATGTAPHSYSLWPDATIEGNLIATGKCSHQIDVIHRGNEEFHFRTEHLEVPVVVYCFSPDGKFLLAGDRDNEVRVYRVEDTGGKPAPASWVYRMPASVATATEGRAVDAFLRDRISLISFSPDGAQVAFATFPKGWVWGYQWTGEPPTGEPRFNEYHSDGVSFLHFSPDGKYLASGGSDNLLHLSATDGSGRVGPLKMHRDNVRAFTFIADGRSGVSVSSSGSAHFWEIVPEAGIVRAAPSYVDPGGKSLYRVSVSPDGSFVVVGGSSGIVQVFDAKTFDPFGEPLQFPGPVEVLQFFESDGGILIGGEHGLSRWKIPDGAESCPDWFPDLLETVGGRHKDLESGQLRLLPVRERILRSQKLRELTSGDSSDYRTAASWFLEN